MYKSFSLLILCVSSLYSLPAYASTSLPKLRLEPQISISGLSSGGYMANQFHLAHAEKINAVGILAAGPYYCSQGSLMVMQAQCLDKKNSQPPVQKLLDIAKQRSQENKLADLSLIKENKIWLFHGTEDKKVTSTVTDALFDFYKALVNEKNISYVNNLAAGHAFPTENIGNACNSNEAPFINNCHYDGAGKMLSHLYGKLSAPSEKVGTPQVFDQSLYSTPGSGLAKEAYIYIPQNCAQGELCKLHISFHGCTQNAESIDQQFVSQTGYNRWAESNNIVVLYPQVKTARTNPYACWDWWGYTGNQFAEREGKQIKSVWNMVNALYQ